VSAPEPYYLLDRGPGVLITISRFDSADEAFASNEKASLLAGEPTSNARQ
jgi:hypothetical protein